MEKIIAWEKLRPIYEAGRISVREIARQFDCSEGAIRKRAKAENWCRDLSYRVLEEVRSTLVRETVRIDNATEKDIIEAASTQIIQISHRNRELIEQIETILRGLLEELLYIPTEEDVLNRLIEIDAPHNQADIVKEMRKMTLSLEKRTALLKTMSETAERLIKLYRLCYGMDANPIETQGNVLADVLQVIANRGQARCLPGSIDAL